MQSDISSVIIGKSSGFNADTLNLLFPLLITISLGVTSKDTSSASRDRRISVNFLAGTVTRIFSLTPIS